jgi:DET1- and DDB1-associated protein 1
VSNFTYLKSIHSIHCDCAVCGLHMQEQRFSSAGACALLQNLPRHPSAPSMLSAVKQTAPERTAATLYIATHDRTEPPADQVVSTERMNALMRQFHQREESRARERQKRAISSSPADDDREPARKASRKNAATATDEGSDGEALPRSGA